MARNDEFDDEGFLDSLLNRKGNTTMPLGLRRIFIVIGVLVVFAVLISVVVSSWPSASEDGDDAAIPIIRADTTPFKEKPVDAGGMNVPNKDSTIFETLKGKQEADSKTENLLDDAADAQAAPEARPPVTPAAAPASVAESAPVITAPHIVEKTGQLMIAAKAEPKTEPQPAITPVKAASVIETLKQDNAGAEEKAAPPSKPVPKPVPKPIPVKPVAAPIKSGGATYIQLASVKSEADVSKQWSVAKSKNPELGGLSMKTQKADLGEKGIYYRIQAGPLTPDNATKVCAAVKSRGGSCIIAK